MTLTDMNSKDRPVQQTFAKLVKVLGWESVYAYNEETFGPAGTLAGTRRRGTSCSCCICGILPAIEP